MTEPVSSRVWPPRGRVADALVTAVTAVTVMVPPAVADPANISPLGWLVMAVASAAVFFRRDYPLVVTVVTLAASSVYLLSPDTDGPIVVTFAIGIYTLMATGRLAAGVLIGALAVVATFYGEYGSDAENLGDLGVLFFAGWLLSVMAIGGAVYNRRAYLLEAERRMAEADRNREQEVRRRTIEERLRIARELHDALGHTISLINVQASAALHRMEKDPEQAGAALGTIKESSQEALQELRTTLGVLRQVDEEAPTAPAPRLSRLADLVDRAGGGEFSVELHVVGEPPPALPQAVDLAGYRIVQEALTNVARHSGARTTTVRVRYSADEVVLEIADDGRGASPSAGVGSGILGMTERAGSVGGELHAGPRPGGGFEVRARLPLGETEAG
ncbi:sensor histidine kinase [Phytoactinopolyspora halotolerans]|uniref:histidine kinase n=1 Tax=Phytoactinopolyspora halotolerans TaxID=1981512 RepID=A0A6L9SJ16_9ACTN|nr:sensor histidine kinase [Phytoactinopolyspora halotolerans]NEE04281.1 sensor histidine kinase [Phytoactinopolyspora halotolerans]